MDHHMLSLGLLALLFAPAVVCVVEHLVKEGRS